MVISKRSYSYNDEVMMVAKRFFLFSKVDCFVYYIAIASVAGRIVSTS